MVDVMFVMVEPFSTQQILCYVQIVITSFFKTHLLQTTLEASQNPLQRVQRALNFVNGGASYIFQSACSKYYSVNRV